MPAQVLSSVENNFTKGLITEFTGLNFPENAATDTNNCVYDIIGDVTRREGFDYEDNYELSFIDRTNRAISSYKWNNAGGDGTTQVVVEQVGATVYFYASSTATIAQPLSTKRLASVVTLSSFMPTGGVFDNSLECQFSDGNGYLFIYHPNCDPLYCTYNAGVITPNVITINIRDFAGIFESGVPVSARPLNLTDEHQYNLANQGWTQGTPWQGLSTTPNATLTGVRVFTVAAGMSVTLGDSVTLVNTVIGFPGGVPQPPGSYIMSGTVTGYVGTTLTLNIVAVSPTWVGTSWADWAINPTSIGYITTWKTQIGNYPSNSDVWWYFKNTSGVFAPSTTIGNVTVATGNAPKGHFTLNAFDQQRGVVAGLAITDITTTVRPRTGTWFQGRVWYTGVDAQQPATGDVQYYSWTENIYFSQVVTDTTQFGNCFQLNDPTSETLFDLLPTDGGVIQIQGCGSIYKLFPLQNALLVFAANGVWYVTGSQGIGFSANDYTIVKLSSIKSMSSTSFVDVNGLPMFWNEEGIYTVEPAKQGGGLQGNPLHVNPLEVNPLTVGTILSFYSAIPIQSKRYVRGAYDPVNYVVQWLYKSANETSVTDRYTFDKALCLNNYNKAFYPYTIDISEALGVSGVAPGCPTINGILYVSSPGGANTPQSAFKYVTSYFVGANSYRFTYSEEKNEDFLDWETQGFSNDYTSYFITGYKLHGQGQRRFQIPYIYVFSRTDDTPMSYKIQSLWDYAITGDSGRWSTAQIINIFSPNFGMIFKRHRLRGQGLVLQVKVSSVQGKPFDIMGWSTFETANQGI